jgi:prepilin-type N-terminal cleavage/methylation domain-containing protein
MKKGFTLMEMLAVVLVVAVIVSMAVPVFRSVRYEMKNSQAKAASKKLAEAMRSFYQSSRGNLVTSACFQPTDTTIVSAAPSTCLDAAATGIPNQIASSSVGADQLFACGYLSAKDFTSLPYHFCTCNPTQSASSQQAFCSVSEFVSSDSKPYVVAYGNAQAGSKFANDSKDVTGYHIYIDHRMQALDNLE